MEAAMRVVVSAELREQAQASDRCIREAWAVCTKLSKRSMEIGWEGCFLKKHDLWPVLGFASESDYRVAAGVARSTWYQNVGLAEKFPRLTKEQFLSMTIENAKTLATVEGDTRYDAELLENAASLKQDDFEESLTAEKVLRSDRAAKEAYSTLQWRVSRTQRKVIQNGLEEWQKEHHIDDPGYALELLVVEYAERATLVGFIQESIGRFDAAVKEAKTERDLVTLRGLFQDHLLEMKECLRLCCGEPDARVA